ncbi:MAG: hypothetical protein ACI9Y1_003233 [Lentisphaeria bacterium]
MGENIKSEELGGGARFGISSRSEKAQPPSDAITWYLTASYAFSFGWHVGGVFYGFGICVGGGHVGWRFAYPTYAFLPQVGKPLSHTLCKVNFTCLPLLKLLAANIV